MTTYQETVSKAQLTSAEHEALADVANHVSYFIAHRRELGDATLGGHLAHELIEQGEIEGHSLSGDTLEEYSSDLASAVRKLEAALPTLNPIEVDESDPFAA